MVSFYGTLFHGQVFLALVVGGVLCGLTGGLFLASGEVVPGGVMALLALGLGLGGWLYGRAVSE